MKSLLLGAALLVAFALLPAAGRRLGGPVIETTFDASVLSSPATVRIGLGGAIDVPSIALRVEGPVRVLEPTGREALWEGTELKTVEVSAAPGPGIRFDPAGGRDLARRVAFALDEVLVAPARDGALWVGKRPYRGTVRLLARGPKRLMTAVNEIDLERYLEGVVASEMGRDGPIEALKAQAVAARSYALHEIRSGYGRGLRGFDLYDDDRSQTYRGVRGESSSSTDAVRATFGEVCLYGEKLLKAFYQNTCGGRTESAWTVFHEQKIPPLAGRACDYCDGSKHYRWRVEVSGLDLAAKIVGSRKFGPIPAARIIERAPDGPSPAAPRLGALDPAPSTRPPRPGSGQVGTSRDNSGQVGTSGGGLVLKVGVTSPMRGNREIVMSASDFRKAVDPAKFKSLAFDVSVAGDRFIIDGRGWGHLVGLCQEGAKGMAERVKGATYRRILDYYYPGITVGRAY